MAKKASPKKAKVEDKKAASSASKVNKTSKKEGSNLNMDTLKYVLPALLIIVVMSFAFYIRSGPITLDGMDEVVRSNTYDQIRGLVEQDVLREYPNLDPAYIEEETNRRFNKVVETGEFSYNGQKIDIERIAQQNADNLKDSFKADNGQTYLNAIDPYHFLRYSELYSKNGYIGDELKEGEPHLSYKLAPNGVEGKDDAEFHVWLESLLFDANGLTQDSDIGDKTRVIFLIPVFFAMLSAIPAFFIIRKYSNDLTAFFGSLLLVSTGTFVSRTIAGFVDTDAYNVFFPLVIVAFLVYAISSRSWTRSAIFAALGGIAQAIFLWAWAPGWFMFIFSALSILGFMGYLLVENLIEYRKVGRNTLLSIQNSAMVLGIYAILSYALGLFFIDRNIFSMALGGLRGSVTNLASISSTNIWPNVLSSVAELNPASFNQILSSIGGKLVFFIAMLGLLFLTLDFKEKKTKLDIYKKALLGLGALWFILFISGKFTYLAANYSYLFLALLFLPIILGFVMSLVGANKSDKLFIAAFLSAWIGGTIYMSLNGVRFILLLAPAFAIGFGIGLYYLSRIVNDFVSKELNLTGKFSKVASGYALISIVFILLFFIVPPEGNNNAIASSAIAISKGTLPNFDDNWYSTMEKIKENSSQDAIITSWWDFGHFFSAIAKRGVTFDGGSQTTPQAHWVGKLLMENDEKVSKDMLSMLVCDGNDAFEYIYNVSSDDTKGVKSVNLLYDTFGKDDDEKREVIEDYKYYDFSDPQIDEIMSRISCDNPPENFLITSQDMVGKAGVWAHWGSWDFTKKYVHDNYQKRSVDEIASTLDVEQSLVKGYIDELDEISKRSSEENIKREDLVNQWFAPYPSYRGEGSCELEDEAIKCGYIVNNRGLVSADSYRGFDGCQQDANQNTFCSFSIDVRTGALNASGTQLEGLFNNVFIPGTDDLEKFEQDTADGVFDITIIPSGEGKVSYLLSQSPLGGSLFTKLFYLNGFGTQHFEKFDDVTSARGENIKTWKVVWDIEEDERSALELTNTSLDEQEVVFEGNNS